MDEKPKTPEAFPFGSRVHFAGDASCFRDDVATVTGYGVNCVQCTLLIFDKVVELELPPSSLRSVDNPLP